ncbi:TetR/AcrR family transcriptional regulator [Nocardia sp. NBC_01327]|uniref:TetR/AcrR family transcriptional regulator n=1 Tax=Nocardia sp. NBC_01327 TaxID=2903593 RepID=UPI002E0D7008|nr:TetR/AcrR family transcriptional regulator [Nocardia sp. NBC_01327]
MPASTAPKRGRPIRMSREAIVDTTLRVLSTSGQDGFSMRGLADELGVSTAAIYHHFPTKAALFIAVLSARAAELDRPELPADPRDRLVVIINHLIEVLHQLPWVAEILVGGESFGRAALWILDEFLSAALALGASDEYAGFMYNAAWRFTLGELITRRAEDERAAEAAAGRPRPRWTDLAPDQLEEFPTASRLLRKLTPMRDDYRSADAVAHLIDGMIAALPGAPAAR